MPSFASVLLRSFAGRVRDIAIGPLQQQHLDDSSIAVVSCRVQGRQTALLARVARLARGINALKAEERAVLGRAAPILERVAVMNRA